MISLIEISDRKKGYDARTFVIFYKKTLTFFYLISFQFIISFERLYPLSVTHQPGRTIFVILFILNICLEISVLSCIYREHYYSPYVPTKGDMISLVVTGLEINIAF